MENKAEIEELERTGLISKNLADIADFMNRFDEYSRYAVNMKFKGGYFSGIQEVESNRAYEALHKMIANFRETIRNGRLPTYYKPFLELMEKQFETTTEKLRGIAA